MLGLSTILYTATAIQNTVLYGCALYCNQAILTKSQLVMVWWRLQTAVVVVSFGSLHWCQGSCQRFRSPLWSCLGHLSIVRALNLLLLPDHELRCIVHAFTRSIPAGLQTSKIETQIRVSNKVQVTQICGSSTRENTSTCDLIKKSDTSRIWTNSLLYLWPVMP